MSRFLLFAACAACLGSTAKAQPVSTEEEERALSQIYGGEEMVSIASGYKQPISQAPSIATVISAADIKAIGATDIDEVLETVPGLHVQRNTIGYNPIYTFRGIFSQFNQQVLMMVNGIPITNSYTGSRSEVWGGMPLRDIARIEVVRGPGSAVYGADAFAGVINIITKTRQDIDGSEIGGRVGSFDTYDGWALHGAEWAGFDVALALEYHNTAGQNAVVDSDLQSQFDRLFGTSASLAPGPLSLSRENLDARIDLARGHWRFRGGLQHRGNFGVGSGVAQALDSTARYGSDRWNADITYQNADIENWELTSQASYFETSQEIERNLTLFPPGTTLPIGGNGQIGAGAPVTFPNGYIGNPEVWERHVRISQMLAYTGFSRHQIRSGIGFNYDSLFQARVSQNFGIDPGSGLPIPSLPGIPLIDVSGTASTFIPEVDRKIAYLFFQDQWNFANDWTLTAGARYDRYSDFGNTFNPRAALIWQADYDLTAKLMYGSAFRAPSFQEMYILNNPAQIGNPQLKPETMENLELGFDYRPADGLRLGLNFFGYWWKDIIRFVPDSNATTATAQNRGVQQGYGGEFEAEWQAADSLKLIGNYAYQRSRDETLHHDAGYAPQHQLYLRANWQFLPDWSFSPQAKWIVGRSRSFGDTREPVADYTWVDLTLRRQNLAKHVELAFSVRNLFDVGAREPSLAGSPQPGIPNDLPLAPRSFYGEISVNF
ncbi:TonB-dependent receptor plug domain-containing protein [Methylomonas koyamae]|uniref:TonB-dependent receptor plug domain-containing protein n=1 Tax=Methylomonas koyamae TaxID=702114 RepID=UPI002873CCF2|nr:TonB-dependent receptor [Methylomonas koyamae]WNB75582.1 TonB-dependent receptor [Methylomonas koyamae]